MAVDYADQLSIKTPSVDAPGRHPVRRQPAEGGRRPLAGDQPRGSSSSDEPDARRSTSGPSAEIYRLDRRPGRPSAWPSCSSAASCRRCSATVAPACWSLRGGTIVGRAAPRRGHGRGGHGAGVRARRGGVSAVRTVSASMTVVTLAFAMYRRPSTRPAFGTPPRAGGGRHLRIGRAGGAGLSPGRRSSAASSATGGWRPPRLLVAAVGMTAGPAWPGIVDISVGYLASSPPGWRRRRPGRQGRPETRCRWRRPRPSHLGAAFGAVNGALVAFLSLPSIVVTLAHSW